jgi:hypothetical protein
LLSIGLAVVVLLWGVPCLPLVGGLFAGFALIVAGPIPPCLHLSPGKAEITLP